MTSHQRLTTAREATQGTPTCTDGAGGQRARVIVALPLPARILSPNGRAHWAKVHRAKQDARWLAKLCARLRLGDSPTPYFPAGTRVRITATAWPRQRNHDHDDDNLKASCKAYLDGFTDAGVWADDRQAVWGDVTWEEPGTQRGQIVLTLTGEE